MSVIIESIRLLSGGVPVGENRGSDTLTTSDAVYSYGGDDWGLTLTGADVNSSSFGVVVSLSGLEATDTYSPAVSNYVKVTNFGFNIPSEDVISEITVFIEAKADAGGNASIDNIKIKLTTSSSVVPIFSVNSDEIVLTSPTVSLSVGAIFSVNSDEIVLTNPSTTNYGYSFIQSAVGVLSLTDPTVSLSVGAIFSVNSDEAVFASPIMSGSGSSNVLPSVGGINLTSVSTNILGKGLYNAIAQVLRFTNLSVNMAWDYLWVRGGGLKSVGWNSSETSDNDWTKENEKNTIWEKQ